MKNYIIELKDISCIKNKLVLNENEKGNEKVYYIKTFNRSKKTSPVVSNLGMVACEDGEDEIDLEDEFEDGEDEIDLEDEFEDGEEEKSIIEKYPYIRLSYYAGLVPLQVVPKVESDDVKIWLHVTPRFDSLDTAKMITEICGDKEIAEYVNTGKGNEWDELITFRNNKIDLLNDKDINVLINRNGELVLSEEENNKIKEQIRQEIKGIEEYVKMSGSESKFSTVEDNLSYSVNLALLFECYVRTKVKLIKSNYKMLPYVPNKKDINKSHESVKCICNPLEGGNEELKTKIYLDGYVVPDIVLQSDDNKEYIVYDVKYKNYSQKKDRMDRLQILAYAYMYNCKKIGHIFPPQKNEGGELQKLGEYKLNNKQQDLEVYYEMFSIGTEKNDEV